MFSDTFARALFLVDAPNICGVYGDLLGQKPGRNDWPRWDRALDNLERHVGPADSHYVVNGNSTSDRLWPFFRQLRHFGYVVDAPTGYPLGGDGDPVDDFIRTRIDSLPGRRDGHADQVIVAAHDHGYGPHLHRLAGRGGKVVIVGFREWLSPDLLSLESAGATYLDLEHDLGAFDSRLNRPYSPDLHSVS